MNTEIELKARIPDWAALKNLLAEKAEYLGAFEKDDTYWFPGGDPGLSASAEERYGLRLRKERRSLADGSERAACIVTRKKKEIRDGVEYNEEREFEVSSADGRPGAEFEEFLRSIGFKPGARKRKKGWAFSRREITAELTEIESLGWFVELEILADNCREETLAGGRKLLLDFLDSLGVERDAVESRPYRALLGEP